MAQQHKEEFLAEAVLLGMTGGLSRKKVATELRVGFSTLIRLIWLHRLLCP